MSTPATAAAPAAQPATPATTTNPEVKPTDAAVPATAEDREEAEYQAKMAEIRQSQKAEEDRRRAEAEADDELEAEPEEQTDEQKQEEAKPEPKVKKFKVNGREVEVDMSDESTVDKLVQKGLGADAKFEHAARIQRNTENFIGAIKDKSQALKILAHPKLLGSEAEVADMCEKYLYDRLQRANMSPDERQREEERAELERLRAKEQEDRQRAESEETERAKENFRKDYTQKFIKALEENDLPKNDWTLTRMAQYMRQAIAKKMKHITPADVAPLVKRDWENVRRSLVTNRTGEQLVKELGEEAVTAIRKHDVEKFKGKRAAAPATRAMNGQFERQEKPRTIYSSAEEMRDAMKKRR